MVAQQILVLFVKVRILVGQHTALLSFLAPLSYSKYNGAYSSAGLEHLSYKQRVIGSNPIGPTILHRFYRAMFVMKVWSSDALHLFYFASSAVSPILYVRTRSDDVKKKCEMLAE